MASCYLSEFFDCTASGKELTSCGPERVRKMIESSKLRQDSIHEDLEKQLSENAELTLNCHRSCVSSYTSTYHIQCYLRKRRAKMPSIEAGPLKRSCRSDSDLFNFREHCLFCGEKCNLCPDAKNPARWRKAFLCRTTDRPSQSFKEAVLEVCKKRNDQLASKVKIRIMGAISDLHAADARYHDDCRKKFMAQRSIASASKDDKAQVRDSAFNDIVNNMCANKPQTWSSKQLFETYKSYGGVLLSRKTLLKDITEFFGDDLIVFSSPGLANIVLFRSTASSLLTLDESHDDDHVIETLAKQVVQECKELQPSKNTYKTTIDKTAAKEEASSTLISFLSSLSAKLDDTLPALLISNMITSILTNKPTSLQIALGIHTREKNKIETLHDFGVTCSYDEVLRFKASAATAAAADVSNKVRAISKSTEGLIQAVADNFDANISSQNGLRTTHALALLMTQQSKNENANQEELEDVETIVRIRKEDMKKQVAPDIKVKHYYGPKKPSMPLQEAKRSIVQLKVLCEQVRFKRRAQDLDFQFLKSIACVPKTPEYGGYNTRLAREQGQSLKPATTAMYTPLIDMVPSDPDTMMTAMCEAQRLTVNCGQTFTVFTADQQLYRVMINVLWVHPQIFTNFIPRLGGMHMLMSFVGCVGILMANTGLEDIMKAAFGGVNRMLSGKNFPQNVRALRMVCEEVLCSVLQDVESYDDMMEVLEKRASQSRTSRLWLDCFIKPVMIMMLFIRAEREGEWTLHLHAVALMMPYFFATGHVNYARYGLYYLRSMEKLPEEVQSRFRKGEHVMRHKPGLWNAIWSDMFIETTFMRYGHGPGGMIGITLSPSTLKRWALSLHTCSCLLKDLNEMRDATQNDTITSHKEEGDARIESDVRDRTNIREKLRLCIQPLNPEEHSDSILNIVTGRIGSSTVNVDDAINIGSVQMFKYEQSWPEGFSAPLTNSVVTMAVSRKGVKCGDGIVYDTQLIFSRVMGLISTRDIDLKELFNHELAPLPTSMFKDNGEMRAATSKSVLKRNLQVLQSTRNSPNPDVIFIDGCAILWCIHWPKNATVQDFIDAYWGYVSKHLSRCDVYLIFDRYYEYSIKSWMRKSRTKSLISHKFKLNAPLPAQQTVLTITENKIQIIDMINEQVREKALNIPSDQAGFRHKLVITGSSMVPQEISSGKVFDRMDLRTSHEEADVIIPQQVVKAVSDGAKVALVVCDDTDVFVLLLHYYIVKNLTCTLLMEGTSSERRVVDIGETARKHAVIVPHLLAAHALSGCDSVAKLSGLGKITVVKKLQQGCKVEKLGNLNADMNEVITEATDFLSACYGVNAGYSMSDVRYKVWLTKTGKKNIRRTPKLQTLPPTSEAFAENVKRAHLQTCIWKSAMAVDPPKVDPAKYGWSKDSKSKSLIPVSLPLDKPPAPDYVLQMICCGCSSDQSCTTARCTCFSSHLACTVFCKCFSRGNCQSRWTKDAKESSEDDYTSGSDEEHE